MLRMHYFDNAATSWPKPEAVYEAVDKFMRENGANPGRSGHCLAKQADTLVEETRELLASFFNAPDPRQAVFTFNGTDGLNMVIKGLLEPGDHAITSNLEHNSVSRPLRAMQNEGVDVSYLLADERGFVHAADLRRLLKPETRLVVLCHASNVLGTVADVAALAKEAHRAGALFALDAAQTAGLYPIDMQAMGIDILIVPGHKGLLGPYGTGAVITQRDVGIKPWRDGGTGTKSDSRLHPRELPYRLEGGTLNAAGIAGLKAALEFINYEGLDKLRRREQEHVQQIIDCLQQFGNTVIYGPPKATERAGLVSFNIKGVMPEELGQRMNDEFKVAGRPGLHCAPMAHRAIRTFPEGNYRLSPGYFTKEEAVEAVLQGITTICRETES